VIDKNSNAEPDLNDMKRDHGEGFRPPKGQPWSHPENEPGPILVKLSTVTPQAIEWLWKPRIAIGKVSMIAGNPGLGKSLVTLDIAARVSEGTCLPDRPTVLPARPGSVILISAEDDIRDTVAPRLIAAGADLQRIEAFQGERYRDGATIKERDFCLEDLRPLREALDRKLNVRLVVIDPVSAFTGNADTHNNSSVRILLAGLKKCAEQYRVAVLCVSHFNKNEGGQAVNRVTGSLAFTAAVRASYAICKDPNDEGRRLFLPLKVNLAPDEAGLAYRVEQDPESTQPVVAWESDPVHVKADDALRGYREGQDRTARDDARAWLRELLANGPVPSQEAWDEAGAKGHSRPTVRRAMNELGVQHKKHGFQGRGSWALPDLDPRTER
jgi:hypothetical protein